MTGLQVHPCSMPAHVPPVTDEREALVGYLAQMRYVLELTAYGLTDEQARTRHELTTMSVGAVIKHVTQTERYWVDLVLGESTSTEADYADAWTMSDDDTLDGLLAAYRAVAARTTEVLADLDLDRPVPVPRDAPWFPDDVEAWSVRWVVLHLITETARHAGHADITRQAVDGATHHPLMAAAEGWPSTPWLQPWVPTAG
jgi:uncharacterized damage-inducible protein DinB